MTRRVSGLLIIAVLIASTVWAQQMEGPITKLYEIKYRKAEDIAKLLVGMNVDVVSGSINRELNTITVRANYEGHAAVEELINKWDVPRKTIELQFYLIRASISGEGLKDGLPERVQRVVREIAGLTRYKSFEVIDTPFIRAQEGNQASMTGNGIYDYLMMFHVQDGVSTGSSGDNKRQIRIDRFQISFSDAKAVAKADALKKFGATLPTRSPSQSLDTSFNIAEGETIVIGASQIESGDKAPGVAVITVVTAKIL